MCLVRRSAIVSVVDCLPSALEGQSLYVVTLVPYPARQNGSPDVLHNLNKPKVPVDDVIRAATLNLEREQRGTFLNSNW